MIYETIAQVNNCKVTAGPRSGYLLIGGPFHGKELSLRSGSTRVFSLGAFHGFYARPRSTMYWIAAQALPYSALCWSNQ